MLRPPFAGHRRYSITHRAVQRLRELITSSQGASALRSRDDEDDETLRDRLDAALTEAEDSGKAIRTLDAMLGEPQTLIPVTAFGDLLYAIIKEDTVVTVLPQGHGEEILQRGQAMEQRVAAGHAVRPTEREEDRWDPRRRWRKEPAKPVVIERIVRGSNGAGSHARAEADLGTEEAPPPVVTPAPLSAPVPIPTPVAPGSVRVAKVVSIPERPSADGPVTRALQQALATGRRKAAVAALVETLGDQKREAALLPLWNELADQGVIADLTIGDLIDAVRSASV
jgi:hypothetical protein